MLTSQALVELALRRVDGARDAVVDEHRRITFGALTERTARLANCLVALGADTRRPVATLLGNRSEYVEVDVAATRAGVPRVGVSERLSPDEWRYILADSQSAVLVVEGAAVERLGDLPDTVESVLVVDGPARAPAPVVHGYEEALDAASAELGDRRVDASDPSFIMYTSGTTGRPKGAWHSHAARGTAALNMLAFELHASRGSAMVHVAPVTHGSGSKVLAFLAAGARNVLLPRFDPEALARAVRDEGATHTFMVPTMIHRLVEESPACLDALRRLEQISFGGAPIAPAEFRTAIERLGPRLVQVYGSCEAPHPITRLRPEDYAGDRSDELLMSAGFPSPAVGLRVVDDGGAEVAGPEVGELQIRAPHLMSGYWNNEAATAETFTEDGWYVTGDLASIGLDGLVTFRDRKKDLIISGGLNIYPSEVERVLLDHPLVKQAVVVGYPDDAWGESVLAYVVAERDGAVSADELTAWTRGRLAGYKKPRTYEFRTELPLGSSHKVLRQELRKALWQGRTRGVN